MRITQVLFLIGLLIGGGLVVWEAMKSSEELIVEQIEDAADGFNNTRLGPCMDLFAPEFVETSKRTGRENIKSGLISLFFTEVDPKTKEFLYRVSIDEIEVEVDGSEATASFKVTLEKRFADKWLVRWAFELSGMLVETEYGGWQFEKATATTLDGSRPR